jgi:uncharacterized protein YdhG (YjbR/CyaY superfamily)
LPIAPGSTVIAVVSSTAATVGEYLAELPPERAAVVQTVRQTILDHLPEGYEEAMNWGMITYQIPLSRHGDTYNGQPLAVAGLAAQARHYSLYLNGVYSSPELTQQLRDAYARAGTKLDMGKSCVRFKRLDDVELRAVGDVIAAVTPDDLITLHEAVRKRTRGKHAG